MNEIKQVIILAAGRSRRMENLSNKIPKCLFEYDNEKIICRLVRQIKKYGVEKIVITVGYRADLMKKIFADDPNVILVNNTMYEEDVNINSMNLALKHIDGPCVVFEADTIMEDSLVKYVLGSDFEGKSVWFTKGKFVEPQYGGILKSDKYGKVTDIRIIPTYQAKYKGYSKLSGLMRINKEQIELFKQLVNKYAKSTIKQYYLVPWIENLDKLPCYEGDISHFEFFTFNKPEEYYQALNKKIGQIEKNVKFLVDINILDGNNVVSISNTKMKIRVAIPNDLKEFNKYEVVYIKDGLIKETLPATLDNGYIVFETTHLSHYGILASTSNPNTGDNIMYYVVTSVLVTICLTSMFVYKKRSDF